MTKKKIRYSDFAAPAPAAPSPAPAAPAATPEPTRSRAPVDLARALAAAKAKESAAEALAPAPAAPGAPVVPAPVAPPSAAAPASAPRAAARLTPLRGGAVIAPARLTPVRGSVVIPRPAMPAASSAPAASAAPSALRERARTRTGKVDLLLVRVGDEWFGVELAMVEEAIDLPAVRHVPEMPPAMLGVITVRGTLTSIYSPASALGVTLASPSSGLVFRRDRSRLGIAVDDVDDVHTLDLAQLRDAPATDTSDGVVLGVLRHRDSLLALVDAEALIAACQTVPAMETA